MIIRLRGTLKKEGFLKRDPRAKERRKFGFKKYGKNSWYRLGHHKLRNGYHARRRASNS
jgi:hypothetical protein